MLHPLLKWAQRKDRVFIQIQLQDIKNEKIDLSGTSFTFEGVSADKNYSCTIQLFEEINKQQSKWTKTGFHLLFVLVKQDSSKPFWSRLTKKKQVNQYIQVDWSKWVDEDDQNEQGQKGLGDHDPSQMQNFDFGNMGGMGGMPGMGGMGGMPGMGGMGGMPGMGGMGGMGGMMGMPGMQGMMDGDEDDEGQGNLDDLDKQEQVQQPQKQ